MVFNFPSFLSIELWHVFPFLDRKDWNSFVLCSREVREAATFLLPPWPENCKLLETTSLARVAWSPDGTKLAVAEAERRNQYVRLYDQRRGLLPGQMHQPCPGGGAIQSLVFSPNGRLLVTADHHCARVWTNVHKTNGDYRLLQDWNLQEEVYHQHVYCVRVSPCGGRVAILFPQRILLKDSQTGSTIASKALPRGTIGRTGRADIVFSKDGKSVLFGGSGGDDYKKAAIICWRPSAPALDSLSNAYLHPKNIMGCHYNDIGYMTMSHDGLRVVASESKTNGTVFLFDINQKGQLDLKGTFCCLATPRAIAFTPDGNYVAVVLVRNCPQYAKKEELIVQFWRCLEMTLAKAFVLSFETQATEASFSPDGKSLVTMNATKRPYWCSGFYYLTGCPTAPQGRGG